MKFIAAAFASIVVLAAQIPQPDPAVPVGPPQSTAPPAAEMTAADVESFLDGLVPSQLDRDDVAGAAISIVKDGQVLLAKGYGYADTTNKTRVTADTLFRPGSISKLFTWTSVMQLVEKGKLDLDRDVNGYIDFNIPAPFGKPITLRHLMTHTPGFEEAVKDLFVPSASDVQPLREYLVTHLPNQIFVPGTMPAYSNYGTALAGYIVQRASGKPFEEYVEASIFKPLGMSHCSFRQPLPASLQPLMSMGYARASAGPKSYEFVNAFPAGSTAVSAGDMTRFMLAHLQDGEYNGVRILEAQTAQLMHTRQLGLHPDMNGMALGFYEETRNGHRIIGHGGDTIYFHSDLHLIADARLGVFVSYNSAGKGESSPRRALWQKFLDRYFPYDIRQSPEPAGAKDDVKAVSGYYIPDRRADTTVIAFTNAIQQAHVYGNADGTLSANIARGLNGEPQKFRAIAPLVFQDVDGQDRLVFQRDAGGRMMMVIGFPALVFQRSSGLSGLAFNATLMIYSLGVMALVLILWPVAAFVRWHYGRTLEPATHQRRARMLARVVCALNLGAVGVAAYLGSLQPKPGAFSVHLDPTLRVMQLVALLGALGSTLVIVHAIMTLRSRAWWWAKVQDVSIAVACAGFAWFVIYWHVLTPGLKY